METVSYTKKIIEKFDSNAQTFSTRVPELERDLYKFIYMEIRLTNKSKMRDFLMHEKYIQNDELFWLMFGAYYTRCPQPYSFHQEITDAIERGTRLELSLSKRIRLSNKMFNDSKGLEKDLNLLETFIAKHTDEEDIEIYRGFLVPVGAEIRVRRYMDHPSSHIQDVGLGFSFTFNKDVAIVHSVLNSSSAMLLKLYGKELLGDKSYKSWKEFLSAFQKMDTSKEMLRRTLKYAIWMKMNQSGDAIPNTEDDVSDYIGFKVRPCTGKYAIKKNDIKTAFNFDGKEMEIFCNPSDAMLLHYEFTSWSDQEKHWKTKEREFNKNLDDTMSGLKEVEESGNSVDVAMDALKKRISFDDKYWDVVIAQDQLIDLEKDNPHLKVLREMLDSNEITEDEGRVILDYMENEGTSLEETLRRRKISMENKEVQIT